jgi:hypothetical protein
MSIILLRGFSHCGKDFIGSILCAKYEYQRFAFADSLKKMVALSTNCPLSQLHSQQGKLEICKDDPQKRTYRQILIDEALRLRNMNSDIFIDYCCREIKQYESDKVVITDWRYANELEYIEKRFPHFKVIPVHIVRTEQSKSPVDDISEYQLVDRNNDYILYNNMDDTIYSQIDKLINYVNRQVEKKN